MRTRLQKVRATISPSQDLLDAARDLLRQAEAKVGVETAERIDHPSRNSSPLNNELPFHELVQKITGSGESGKVIQLQGSRTLMMAWAGQICGSQGWCGVVGMPDFGWAAAAHLGIPLERSLVIPQPQALAAPVISTLLEGCDVVLVGEEIPGYLQRRLTAKARAHRCHILTEGSWHQPHHRFDVISQTYSDPAESLGAIELALTGVQERYHFRVGTKGLVTVPESASRLRIPQKGFFGGRREFRQVHYA